MYEKFEVRSYQVEPYDYYAKLRKDDHFREVQGVLPGIKWSHLATQYQDVSALIKDQRLSSDLTLGGGLINVKKSWLVPQGFRSWMSSLIFADMEDHARLRKLVAKAFKAKVVMEMEDKIVQICNDLMDAMESKEDVDFIEDFAIQLPLTVISEMMGIPKEKSDQFRKYSFALVDQMPRTFWDLGKQFKNYRDLQKFFDGLIELKRQNPGDDLTTVLISVEEDGDRLNHNELVGMLIAVLAAGFETTVTLLGSGLLTLLENPDQLESFKQDPSLAGTMVEELLRFTNPVHYVTPRFAKEDFEFKGKTIKKGENIFLIIGAANRDEAVFENPDTLDITRSPNKHLAFGTGAHHCIGAQLARMEAQKAFTLLFERYPDIRLAVPASELQWRKSQLVRGLVKLPVNLNGKADQQSR